jgi:hypothetical protein
VVISEKINNTRTPQSRDNDVTISLKRIMLLETHNATIKFLNNPL